MYGTLWKRGAIEGEAYYLDFLSEDFSNWGTWLKHAFMRLGAWALMFTNLIPISMLVTLDTVRLAQGLFMQWDYTMFDISKDMPVKVQSSNLNEELGKISYLFTDKTGTLTCNIMEFKKFSAGFFSYGLDGDDLKLQMNSRYPNLEE